MKKNRPHSVTLCIKSSSVFVAGIAAHSAFAAPTGADRNLLSPIQSWQCVKNAALGAQFARESLVHAKKSCTDFLSNQNAIVAPLLQASGFSPAQFTQACYLKGYRDEVVSALESVREACIAETGQNFTAGLRLGHLACRLATEESVVPRFTLHKMRLMPFDPNAGLEFVDLVHPVRSEDWTMVLARSQYTGFSLGCVLGERDVILGVGSPHMDAMGKVDWKAAGQDLGEEFGRAFCPMDASARTNAVATLVGAKSGAFFDSALNGFTGGFTQGCAL